MNNLTLIELLARHVQIGEELRARGIVRTDNNPTGDLAEYLFCKAFGWEQAPNSKLGFDAVDTNGLHYQIKGRRINNRNKSRQLSAIRGLEEMHFDFLAGVLFDHNYNVFRAVLIPHSVIIDKSKHQSHTNSSKFLLNDDVWLLKNVRDVTDQIKSAMHA